MNDIDIYTIVQLKREHGLIDEDLIKKFYEVNKAMWDLEEKITVARTDEEVGKLYRELRALTKVRARLKSDPKTY